MALINLTGFLPGTHNKKTEITSGVTTFITICYILAVIPAVLGAAGIDKEGAFTVTAVITAATTLFASVSARQPYVLGPSLGLNAFFAFTIVSASGYTAGEALTFVFVEALLFLILVSADIHRYILESIPSSLRNALVAGIGMFISFIGLKNAGIIVSNPETLVQAGNITPNFIIGVMSVLLSGIFIIRGITGAMFYSILLCTLAGIPLGVTDVSDRFQLLSFPTVPSLMDLDFGVIGRHPADAAVIIFTLLLINVFDALGGMIGVSSHTGDGGKEEEKHVKKAFMVCSAGTLLGSLFGMSPISVMAESSSGAAAGGRTGMSAAVAGLLFIVALFLSPVFMLIPLSATTGCLVIVGVYMISSVASIDFKDMSEALPAYITILSTVLTFSIAEGICFGVISYVVIKLFTRRYECLNIPLCILAVLFIIKEII